MKVSDWFILCCLGAGGVYIATSCKSRTPTDDRYIETSVEERNRNASELGGSIGDKFTQSLNSPKANKQVQAKMPPGTMPPKKKGK